MKIVVTDEAVEAAAEAIFACLGSQADPVLGMDFTRRIYRAAALAALTAVQPHLKVEEEPS